MAYEITKDEVVTEEGTATQQPENTISTQLQQAIWEDRPIEQKTDEVKTDVVTDAVKVDEIPIPKEWLKKEFDIEDPAILKAEREEYKKLKETPPAPEEIKFADDQSKHIHELLREGKKKEVKQFLETQEKLETFATAEVTAATAEEIIKLSIGTKNKSLTQKEIDFQYKEDFVAPNEPVQRKMEEDDEFKERHDEWKEKVERLEMKKIVAAKMAQPELAKLKTELVLPEISPKENQQTQRQPTQEELDNAKKFAESFLKSAETTINEFKGFSTQVKDKDVDYTVAYSHSKEEKDLINSKIKLFVESGFNANAVFADDWMNPDGKTINVNKMTEDLLRIYTGKSADQKIASEAANQRLELYLKQKKNINVNETKQNGDFKPDGEKSTSEKLQEQFWSN